jgi:N-acetylmuramoyl-L-alanine amidase
VARVRAAVLATDKYRVVLTRTGDINVTSEQRALAANLSGAICFLSFHAGDLGTAIPRITLFTYLPPTATAPVAGGAPASPFVPWGQVQEARLGKSLQLGLALQQQFALIDGVEVDLPATAPVRSLRNVDAPAVAIELGRLAPDEDSTALANPAFQQQVAGAVVQALASFAKGGNQP